MQQSGNNDGTCLWVRQVELVVEVQGIPPPTIVWYKDADEITEDNDKIMMVNHEDSGISSLVLNDAQASDGGEIKCVATNEIGSATTTAFLSVEGRNICLHIGFTSKRIDLMIGV